jgi:hypothetical protein
MAHFYQPDLSTDLDSPFVRDGEDKLIRRSYWLDMDDRTLVMVMVNGIGATLTNDEKRAHTADWAISAATVNGPRVSSSIQ